MKFTVNIEKRYTYIILGVLSIFFVGVLVVALSTSIDTSKGYHESTQVNVNIPGVGEKTLQESIDAGDLAGGSGIIPSGAVMPFNLASCPSGWSPLAGGDGRVIIGTGTLGSDTYTLLDTGGEARHTLTEAEMPNHSHLMVYWRAWTRGRGLGEYQASQDDAGNLLMTNAQTQFSENSILATGGDQPHENRPPYLALLYCQKN